MPAMASKMQEFVLKSGLARLLKKLDVGPVQSRGRHEVKNNPDLTTEGQAGQLVGKFQEKAGQIEKGA